jgi:hypothetical protein
MRILDKHLWKATLSGLIIAWIALVTLDVFFAFINEVRKTQLFIQSCGNMGLS